MGSSSKVLLELEGNSSSSSASYLDSKLLLTRKGDALLQSDALEEKPCIFPVPKSQVLGKLKDFLGVISESNKTLMQDAKKNPDSYDIEVLSEKESHYIEMDLMLGIADLHTPEAVSAAESALAGCPSRIHVVDDSDSESEDEEISDEVAKDAAENGKQCSKVAASKAAKKDRWSKSGKNGRSRKRPKIEELC